MHRYTQRRTPRLTLYQSTVRPLLTNRFNPVSSARIRFIPSVSNTVSSTQYAVLSPSFSYPLAARFFLNQLRKLMLLQHAAKRKR
jgi:hypothetical protein